MKYITIPISEICPKCRQPIEHIEQKKNLFIIYCTNQKCKYEKEILIINKVI